MLPADVAGAGLCLTARNRRQGKHTGGVFGGFFGVFGGFGGFWGVFGGFWGVFGGFPGTWGPYWALRKWESCSWVSILGLSRCRKPPTEDSPYTKNNVCWDGTTSIRNDSNSSTGRATAFVMIIMLVLRYYY